MVASGAGREPPTAGACSRATVDTVSDGRLGRSGREFQLLVLLSLHGISVGRNGLFLQSESGSRRASSLADDLPNQSGLTTVALILALALLAAA